MQNHEVSQYYGELAAINAKYGIAGFVAVWFDGPSDNYGFVTSQNPSAPDVTAVCAALSEKLRGFMDEVYTGPTEGHATAIVFNNPCTRHDNL